MSEARVLASGAVLGVVVLVVTHPLAVAGLLGLAIVFAQRTGALHRAPYLAKLALGIGLSVAVLNALFSWNGATELWRAPFRLALLGRPRLTLEAIAWGALAGAQLAASVLALGTATVSVAPETLHRALSAIGMPRSFASAGSLALRMVPDTARDAAAMKRALRTRGLATDGARGTAQVLVPLTARSLDRALLAEEALVLRGYGAGGARRARVPRAPALGALAAVAVAAAMAVWGPARPAYYPFVDVAVDPPSLALIALVLVLPAWFVSGVVRSSA